MRLRRRDSSSPPALVTEAGLLQANADGRPGFPVNEIKERYVFYIAPLVGICFALYARRGWPIRVTHLALAAGLLILSVRVPLSGFAVASTLSASPILFAVYWLTVELGGPGNAAGVVAAAVGLMSVVACSRPDVRGWAPRSCSGSPCSQPERPRPARSHSTYRARPI